MVIPNDKSNSVQIVNDNKLLSCKNLVSSSSNFDLDEAIDDEEEEGDTDSVAIGDDIDDLDRACTDSLKEELNVLVKMEESPSSVLDSDENWVLCKDIGDATYHKCPDDWEAPSIKKKKGESAFEDVDNPGGWDQYCFNPRFLKNKSGKYEQGFYKGLYDTTVSHSLLLAQVATPSGKMAVPE